ncbi:hypothetical protein C7T94_17090 [Pedobacter yulinensis]|uniref:Uncharacterized protein n=1 Tax=Pedobacter yulinensis TaxID=2126353 RepID=A0A2T3HHJ1_9SPHI|nr:hypothetical protein [Pedobacter yulinensis]PST81909.1 hypothetical protein C7T94_17090 [Pedobacter yulinensis]
MNKEAKKTTDKPGSNFEEIVPEGKVDKGDKVVKKPEDKDYDGKEPKFDSSAKSHERGEQPVDPIKKAPKKP